MKPLAIGRTLCKTHHLWSWDGEVVGKEIKQSSVTHSLFIMDETAWQIKQCHSLPVGHGMRND